MAGEYKGSFTAKQAATRSTLLFALQQDGTIDPMDSIGQRVKMLRKAKQLNQETLAAKLGISQPALSQIERGTTVSLSGEVLAGLCRHLSTTPDFILSGAGTANDYEAEMAIAEVASIMRQLSPQVREALLNEARLLARATLPAAIVSDLLGIPMPKATSDRRHHKVDVKIDRRRH